MTYSDFTKRVNQRLKCIRRKQRLRAVLGLLVFLAVLICIYLVGAHLARPWLDKLDNIEAAALATTTVTIGPGDTLWHIARDRYPDMDPREAVYQIRQLNPGMNPGALQVGQAIIVPEVG